MVDQATFWKYNRLQLTKTAQVQRYQRTSLKSLLRISSKPLMQSAPWLDGPLRFSELLVKLVAGAACVSYPF